MAVLLKMSNYSRHFVNIHFITCYINKHGPDVIITSLLRHVSSGMLSPNVMPPCWIQQRLATCQCGNWWTRNPWETNYLFFISNLIKSNQIKSPAFMMETLKQKGCHFDEVFITESTGNCQFDNFPCSLASDENFVKMTFTLQFRSTNSHRPCTQAMQAHIFEW